MADTTHRLTEEQRERLRRLEGKRLPWGMKKALAKELGTTVATVSRYTAPPKGRKRAKSSPKLTKLVGGAISALPISNDPPPTYRAVEGDSGALEGIVEAPVSPLDTVASLDVLRAIRDDGSVPPETRARAAVSLLQHGAKDSAEDWTPPCDAEGWASVLVELVNEEPPAVRGLLRMALGA